jgi:hypothetical protein
MQPILAADSFRLNSGDFQVQSVYAVSSDAAKSADDLVRKLNGALMAQKWYQKASVQTAIVSGFFLLIGIAIPSIFQIPALKNKIDQLEKENSAKTDEIQRLETQLTPFRTIALEKFTGSEKEALRQLAGELEKLKDYVNPYKKNISYAIAEIEVIIESDNRLNTTFMDRGGLLVFVKDGESLLLVSDTKSTVRQHGEGKLLYTGTFQMQSKFSQLEKPVEILKDSDLIQIEFSKIPENSIVLGGKASIIINGDLRLNFVIPAQQMTNDKIFINEIKDNF